MDDPEKRRLSLLQFSALVGMLSMVGYAGLHALADWQVLGGPILITLGCIPLYALVMVLNYRGYSLVAKLLFCSVLTGSMFVVTYFYLGRTPGMHFFFLLAALVPLLLWKIQQFLPIVIFMVLSLTSFLLVEYRVDESFILIKDFPQAWILFYRGMSVVAVYVTLVIILAYFQHRADADARSIGDKARLMEELMHKYEALAKIDTLTELLNRRAIHFCLHEEIVRMNRNHTLFSVLLLDVDHFKEVNDAHGHEAGDLILKELSRVLVSSVREMDKVGRWGGEEFLILLPDTSLEGASVVAEKIRVAVERREVVWQTEVLRCTVTLGAALHDADADLEETIRRADEALYRGKEAGRNRVVFAR